MDIYLSPLADEQHAADLARLAPFAVTPLVINYQTKLSVQRVVHTLSHHSVRTLVLPDDYHRHNELIEHVKACAHHMGLQVAPVSRYIRTHPPAPAQHPVHANAATAGVGGG